MLNTFAERADAPSVPNGNVFSLNLPRRLDDKLDSNAGSEQPNRSNTSQRPVNLAISRRPSAAADGVNGFDLRSNRTAGPASNYFQVDTIGKPVLDLAAIPIQAAPMG